MAANPEALRVWRMFAMLAALACCASVQAGGVYKWTDAQGVLHYDDSRRTDSLRLTREYVEKRQVRETPDWLGVVPAEFAAEVQARCRLERDRLGNYRGALQLYGRDPGGNVYLMSSAQTKLMILETERAARRYCSPDSVHRLLTERRAELGKGDQPLSY